ncbi:MAG TPA: glutathione-disulfide reductase [Oceanospirillaceae bacterium]|nr:glutathione-disulfide reductase [Oceanospirillaceae bacterium]
MSYDFDVFVIGAGSGGVRTARMAAAAGAKVAVADDRALGGTCVNVGCVPKKLYTYASHFSHDFENAQGFGWQVPAVTFDWPTLVANKKQEISRLNTIYGNLLNNSGAQIIAGYAQLKDAHTVTVSGQDYTAQRIVIATGGTPNIPAVDYADLLISSDQIFDLPEFPKRLLVVGAGYIALEFACIFQGLGSQVEVSYRGDLIMRGFDQDVRQFVDQEMRKQGIVLTYQSQIENVEKQADGSLLVTFNDGSKRLVDQVLMAIGRNPRLQGIGLERLGIETTASGVIAVNAKFQTNINSIYALGDVTGGIELTPVALAEAMTLVNHWYGDGTKTMDYEFIPTAVFTQPNVGTIGLTEQQARDQYSQIEVYSSDFKPMKHTLSGSDERSFMKLIVDKTSDRVIGLHIVGEGAGEMLQGFGVAIKAGATKADFDATIGIHPTSAEELVTMRVPN